MVHRPKTAEAIATDTTVSPRPPFGPSPADDIVKGRAIVK
jgi:hypothetical protein